MPCDGPRMNPSVDVGNPPRPFRHLRMAERRSPDPSSSRVPVHSALVQKSVTAITNPAGRLSIWMLGKSSALSKWKTAKSWQAACNQSNASFTKGLARRGGRRGLPLQNPILKSVQPARKSAWFLRRIMEVLDSVDTDDDMSAETRARIFEPFYPPKATPECSHVISKIIFSRAQRNRALRQCDQSTSDPRLAIFALKERRNWPTKLQGATF